MKNGDMAAAPVTLTDEQLNEYQHPMVVLNGSRGLTKREYFAGLAMQGILSDPDGQTSTQAARTAVRYADALLAALEDNQ